jgi:hypothetical protein
VYSKSRQHFPSSSPSDISKHYGFVNHLRAIRLFAHETSTQKVKRRNDICAIHMTGNPTCYEPMDTSGEVTPLATPHADEKTMQYHPYFYIDGDTPRSSKRIDSLDDPSIQTRSGYRRDQQYAQSSYELQQYPLLSEPGASRLPSRGHTPKAIPQLQVQKRIGSRVKSELRTLNQSNVWWSESSHGSEKIQDVSTPPRSPLTKENLEAHSRTGSCCKSDRVPDYLAHMESTPSDLVEDRRVPEDYISWVLQPPLYVTRVGEQDYVGYGGWSYKSAADRKMTRKQAEDEERLRRAWQDMRLYEEPGFDRPFPGDSHEATSSQHPSKSQVPSLPRPNTTNVVDTHTILPRNGSDPCDSVVRTLYKSDVEDDLAAWYWQAPLSVANLERLVQEQVDAEREFVGNYDLH